MRPCRALLAAFLLLASSESATAQTDAPLRPTPPAFVPPLLTEPQVAQAIDRLDDIVEGVMAETGVPGIAVTVVYRDEVVYTRGFGVREVGRPELVDTGTVFQLASVSKPIASTVVASVVGRGRISWDEPVRRYTPAFDLSDPYVSSNVTLADLLSHRSGLYTSAGDLLEDLGYDRSYILARLDQQPLDAFRSSYNYSNFGYTAGAEAAAAAAETSWEELADDALFGPLGMTRTSYRHADFLARKNRARLHVRNASGEWAAEQDRRPDPQAPAGGASGSIADVARFLRLHLAGGTFEGRQVVEAETLAATYAPHAMPAPPRTPLSRASFYGLGWNVGYDHRGRLEIGHAGAFYIGASTYLGLIPGEQLGIAVVTNGEPIGVPEGIARTFIDIADNGRQTVDWLPLFARVFAAMRTAEAAPFDYGAPPVDARKPGALTTYVGRYDNPYYGPLTVADRNGHLTMELGPRPETFELTHHDGDTFTFQPIGENAVPRAGVTFGRQPEGVVSRLVIDFYDQTGLGTFVRSQQR